MSPHRHYRKHHYQRHCQPFRVGKASASSPCPEKSPRLSASVAFAFDRLLLPFRTVQVLPSCLPSLGAGLLSALSVRPAPSSGPLPVGTMKALTPAVPFTAAPRVSPLTATHLPDVPSPSTWCARSPLLPPRQRDQLFPGFAMNEQARRCTPPYRVRYPTDRQFASGCSPPRLSATQLPSATGLWLTPTRTCTVLMCAIVGALIPANAGTHTEVIRIHEDVSSNSLWVPAFAGMTMI